MYKSIFNCFIVLLSLTTITQCTNCTSSKNIRQVKVVTNSKDSVLCIPSVNAAIKVAEKELLRIYGESINEKKPFTAELEKDQIWIISGTLKMLKDKKTKLITTTGGVPYIRISARDCKILQVGHTK